MKQPRTPLYRYLYLAYRALWRGWILWLVYFLALAIGDNGRGGFLITEASMFIFLPLVIWREIRQPQPEQFGFYSDHNAFFTTILLTLIVLVNWFLPYPGYHYPARTWIFLLVAILVIF